MPTQNHLVAFDRPLAGAAVRGRAARLYTEAEVAALKAAAYREGYDAAHAFSDKQLLEFREEVQSLQDGLLQNLPNVEAAMNEQLRAELPGLALELARRLLAGYEPSADVVERICLETLEQLYPERENLELILSVRDAGLLEKSLSNLNSRYPGLKVRPDPTLAPGDCQVRSRFGLTDARLSSKTESLRRELAGAA